MAISHDRRNCRFVVRLDGEADGKVDDEADCEAYVQYKLISARGKRRRLAVSSDRLDGDVVDAFHTYVPSWARGQRHAERLCLALFAWAKSEGFYVKPSCSYISDRFLLSYPQYQPISTVPVGDGGFRELPASALTTAMVIEGEEGSDEGEDDDDDDEEEHRRRQEEHIFKLARCQYDELLLSAYGPRRLPLLARLARLVHARAKKTDDADLAEEGRKLLEELVDGMRRMSVPSVEGSTVEELQSVLADMTVAEDKEEAKTES
eukprot:PLAT3322.17.p1 GENE.PLAT3322.17~~PLAT3322.17.p1  ORF type:complete len:263 (+),score=62.58 PLAT3322.17:2-790(+)